MAWDQATKIFKNITTYFLEFFDRFFAERKGRHFVAVFFVLEVNVHLTTILCLLAALSSFNSLFCKEYVLIPFFETNNFKQQRNKTMMKPVVLSEKVEKQDPKGPFFKHKSYDHFLSFTDVGKKCFYQQEADFAAVSEYLLSNVEVMRQELSQITEVTRDFCNSLFVRLIL